ncbi:MAG: DUF4397 domain-containing protein [Ignavibacteriaceae bacterium]|nr:DUF4397 domain-containing protein [Ignavibacteriaceae bacterium]
MKKLLFALFVLTSFITLNAQTARLQVIHNAADPLASQVDVYVNGGLLLDNFAFRTATPFIDVPAGVLLNIGIAPYTSTSVNDTIKNFGVTLTANKKYVVVANGVIDPSGFAPNPNGLDISFTLFARDNGKEQSLSNKIVEIMILHGSTDAPTVDVLASFNRNFVGALSDINSTDLFASDETFSSDNSQSFKVKLVNDASYGDFTRYLKLPALNYKLDITPGDDNNVIVATFNADLRTLGGGAAVVFASGFLNPGANQNGPAFGLFAALPNGTVIALPQVVQPTTARLQVIHNAADPLADQVDVYVNGGLLLDNFAFRTATPYIDVPAGVTLNIGVAPFNSTSVNDTIKNFPVIFDAGKTYVAIANGVLTPSNFTPNPDGKSIAFTLFAKADAKETSFSSDIVELFAVHGSTDAPSVNIVGAGFLLNGVSYGDISGYTFARPVLNRVVVFIPSPFTLVGVYNADLTGLGGSTAVVFASGFVNPAGNQNGAAFGLFAALPNGTVVQLPQVSPAEASDIANKILAENNVAKLEDFNLSQNYPNPFNPSTRINYSIPQNSFVSLKVYDVLGNEVANLVDEQQSAGKYEVIFDGSNLASGIYLYTIKAGDFTSTKKLVLMK